MQSVQCWDLLDCLLCQLVIDLLGSLRDWQSAGYKPFLNLIKVVFEIKLIKRCSLLRIGGQLVNQFFG